MREISKQRIDYRPNIKYTSDYYTQGKTVSQSNYEIENGFRNNRVPLDTYTIPNIENNINFLNTALPLLPNDLYKAIKEVYDPICDVFYEELIDKIIDPNPQIPEMIIKPVDSTPNPGEDSTDNPNNDPTNKPGNDPSDRPDNDPSNRPGKDPADIPGYDPTDRPGKDPIYDPTDIPGYNPSDNPDKDPTYDPSDNPDNNKGYVFPIILRPIKLKKDPNDSDDDPDDGDDNDPDNNNNNDNNNDDNNDDNNNDDDNDDDDDDDDNDDEKEDKGNVFPIILRPMDDNKNEDGPKDEDEKYVFPIILKPMNNFDNEEELEIENRERVFPIILRPIKDNDEEEEEEENRKNVFPIILRPIYDDDDDDDDDGDDEIGLWDPPSKKIEYIYPDLNEAINREFVYLLSKITNHYTSRLKDIVNNYLFNIMKCNLQQSEENINFISNKLELTSNDILNHSKHLLDSSVKSENTAALRTEFFKNVFNIRDTVVYLRSFMVSHELRKRYTNINYSKGKSMANSMSDSILEKLNIQYELQYRKNFENLFRYLESSLKVTDDILRLYIRDGLSKSTIIKKGGIK